jgi:type III secretion protein T
MTPVAETLATFLKVFDREVFALFLTLPRLFAYFAASQLFPPTSMPRLARTALILVLAIIAVPINLGAAETVGRTVPTFALLFAKEYLIGFLLGYTVGWVFWSVQSVGALIDNQRGAAIASSIDPLQGHETSPLGIMFSQVFLTYIFTTGAILPLIGLVYQSYLIWPAGAALPDVSSDLPRSVLALADHALSITLLLAGPIIAVMFLAEFALALVSRFAPQIQVFILAMPIKSALAIFMLIFYLGVMLPFANDTILGSFGLVDRLTELLPPEGRQRGPIVPLVPLPATPSINGGTE